MLKSASARPAAAPHPVGAANGARSEFIVEAADAYFANTDVQPQVEDNRAHRERRPPRPVISSS